MTAFDSTNDFKVWNAHCGENIGLVSTYLISRGQIFSFLYAFSAYLHDMYNMLTLRHKLSEWIFIYLSKNEMRFPNIIIIDVYFNVSVTYRQYRYDSEWPRFFVLYSRCYCNALNPWYWRWIDCFAYLLHSLCNLFRSFRTSLNKWMSGWRKRAPENEKKERETFNRM